MLYKVLNNDKSDRYDKFKLRNKHNKNVKNNFQFKRMKSSFVISMMILLDVVDGHGIILVGWSLCSKFFFPFVDNDSPCGSLELQSLTNGFVTLFRLMDVNDSGMISWFNSSGTNQAWVWPLKLNSEVYWGYLCIILKCV